MKVYLDQGGVVIDSSKMTVGGTSYPLNNISAYRAATSMKDIFDWKDAAIIATVIGVFISGISWYFAELEVGPAITLGVVIWVAYMIFMKNQNEPNKPVFDFSYLEITSAGTSKHAVIVYDYEDGLAFDAKDALDDALADHSGR